MSQLTGPPRLGGIVRPHASIESPVSDEWIDESRTITLRGGRIKRVGARRLRARWTVGYRALSEGEALAWRSDLLAEPLLWTPRTRAEGDPDWLEEVEVEVRLLSPLSTLEPLWRAARGVWTMEVELEALGVVERVPGTATGGFYLVSETSEDIVIEPYGDATAQVTRYNVSYRGIQGERAHTLLGPAAVIAMRAEAGDLAHAAFLTTTKNPD